ncbi:MAG: hypothetical protein AAGA56_01645 [Myxococcota bacterium]
MVAGTVAFATRASAQPVDNTFAVDLYQGAILAPTRIAAMGGAYAGLAEGTAGLSKNAAAAALRGPYSMSWFDYDADASFSVPLNLFENDDFDNSGTLDADYSNFIYFSGAFHVFAGAFGMGFFGDFQRYSLSFEGREASTNVVVGRYHLLGGWRFVGNQIIVGGGARAVSLSIDDPTADLAVFGVAPQAGFLVRPDWLPFRVGATYRHPVRGRQILEEGETVGSDGLRRTGDLLLPDTVELPWEVELGFAIQVGSRPLNPEWIDPQEHEDELREHFRRRASARRAAADRRLAALPPGPARDSLAEELQRQLAGEQQLDRVELERRLDHLKDERRVVANGWPRDALLFTADLLLSGPVADAVSLEQFLSQGQTRPEATCETIASGRNLTLSPRFGIEVEPFPNWVHTRFGTYYEPQRYSFGAPACEECTGRQHFTFGADVKLFSTTWFGLSREITYTLQGFGDLAPRYQSFGIGLGVWH